MPAFIPVYLLILWRTLPGHHFWWPCLRGVFIYMQKWRPGVEREPAPINSASTIRNRMDIHCRRLTSWASRRELLGSEYLGKPGLHVSSLTFSRLTVRDVEKSSAEGFGQRRSVAAEGYRQEYRSVKRKKVGGGDVRLFDQLFFWFCWYIVVHCISLFIEVAMMFGNQRCQTANDCSMATAARLVIQ